MEIKQWKPFLFAVLAVGTAASLTACSQWDETVLRQKEAHYTTHANAPSGGDLAFTLPGWIPKDAKNIDIRVNVSSPGTILRYQSATSPSGCTPKSLSREPLLKAEWWPTKPKDGQLCGGWNTFSKDGYTYAYTTSKRTFNDAHPTPTANASQIATDAETGQD